MFHVACSIRRAVIDVSGYDTGTSVRGKSVSKYGDQTSVNFGIQHMNADHVGIPTCWYIYSVGSHGISVVFLSERTGYDGTSGCGVI